MKKTLLALGIIIGIPLGALVGIVALLTYVVKVVWGH